MRILEYLSGLSYCNQYLKSASISYDMDTRALPDMYALGPVALGLLAYISGKALFLPMLRLKHM